MPSDNTSLAEPMLTQISAAYGVTRPPVTGGSPHKGPVTPKMFPFDKVVMASHITTKTKTPTTHMFGVVVSLTPSDDVWCHKTYSVSVQVIAPHLFTYSVPSHYPKNVELLFITLHFLLKFKIFMKENAFQNLVYKKWPFCLDLNV